MIICRPLQDMQEKFTLGDITFLCSIESEANSKMITCAELTVE